MLDIGWTELLIVVIVLVVVVGPKELPHLLRTFGKTMTRFRRMASDFRSQLDGALKEADLEDVSSVVKDVRKLNPANQLRDALNPLRDTARDLQADLNKSTSLGSSPATGSNGSSLPKASYPTPGETPDFSPENIFGSMNSRTETIDESVLVSRRPENQIISRRPGFKPAPRPIKQSGSHGRKGPRSRRNDR